MLVFAIYGYTLQTHFCLTKLEIKLLAITRGNIAYVYYTTFSIASCGLNCLFAGFKSYLMRKTFPVDSKTACGDVRRQVRPLGLQ
jgi:hypothetical protein